MTRHTPALHATPPQRDMEDELPDRSPEVPMGSAASFPITLVTFARE